MEPKLNDSLGAHLLREWRTSRNLTQTEMAAKLGVDMVKVSKFECGAGKPGRSTAARIDKVTEGRVPFTSWDMAAPVNAGDGREA